MTRARTKAGTAPLGAGAAKPASLPMLLQEIAAATDVDTALAVAKAKGGARAYFCQRPAADNWLSVLLGPKRARIIGEAIAPASVGVELEVPMGPAKAAARRLLIEAAIARGFSRGDTMCMLALDIGVHRQTVKRHVRRMTAEGRLPERREARRGK